VDDYLYSMLPPRDEGAGRNGRLCHQAHRPHRRPAVARVLQQLAMMINAKHVFEMGSHRILHHLVGARGGRRRPRYVHRRDAENAERARATFARAGVGNPIDIRIAMPWSYSPSRGRSSTSFCDVDKEDYPRAFRLVAPRLRKGVFSSPTTFYGAPCHPKKSVRFDDESDSGIQPPGLQVARPVHYDASHSRWLAVALKL